MSVSAGSAASRAPTTGTHLDAAVEAERGGHGQKPLKPRERQPVEKETKVSRTDPESGYMVRDGKPKGFFYLDHRTVDGRLAIITDTFTTPANVHDSIVYLSRLDRQRARFGFDVAAVGLDAGYATAGIAKGLEDRDILGVTGYRNPTPPKPGMMRKSMFVYDAQADAYRCPQGQPLAYAIAAGLFHAGAQCENNIGSVMCLSM